MLIGHVMTFLGGVIFITALVLVTIMHRSGIVVGEGANDMSGMTGFYNVFLSNKNLAILFLLLIASSVFLFAYGEYSKLMIKRIDISIERSRDSQ
jgi:hypothetical protein